MNWKSWLPMIVRWLTSTLCSRMGKVVFDRLFPQKLQLFHGRQAQPRPWGEIGRTPWVGGRGVRRCKWGRKNSWSSFTASWTSRRRTSWEWISWRGNHDSASLFVTGFKETPWHTSSQSEVSCPSQQVKLFSVYLIASALSRYEDENSLGNEAIFLNAGKKPDDCKMVARAVFSFQAQNNRELSFKKGDIIYIKKQVGSNILKGSYSHIDIVGG